MKSPKRGVYVGGQKPQERNGPNALMDGMRFLPVSEHFRTRKLWEEAFPEDSPRFLEYYGTCMADHNRICVDEENGEIVSMIHLNPYRVMAGAAETDCSYLVAVATKKEFRRQGRMRGLLKMALEDCRKRGEPFAYLMPAAEAIYEPFGFRTVGFQSILPVGNAAFEKEADVNACGKKCADGAAGAMRCVPVKHEQLPDLAALSQRVLSRTCAVYAKRDLSYFERIFKEQEAVNGSLLRFCRDKKTVGYCRTETDEGLEIREMVLDLPDTPQDYADAAGAAAAYLQGPFPAKLCGFLPGVRVAGVKLQEFSFRPVTMARIADPEAFGGLLRAKKHVEQTLKLSDAFLPENSGLWRLKLAPDHGELRRLDARSCESGDPLCLTIEEFTDAAFGRCQRAELCGKMLRPLSPVYLQELV